MLTSISQQIFTFNEIQAIDPLFNPTKTKSSFISKLSTSLSKEVLCSDMFSYLMKITREKMSFKLFVFETERKKWINQPPSNAKRQTLIQTSDVSHSLSQNKNKNIFFPVFHFLFLVNRMRNATLLLSQTKFILYLVFLTHT